MLLATRLMLALLAGPTTPQDTLAHLASPDDTTPVPAFAEAPRSVQPDLSPTIANVQGSVTTAMDPDAIGSDTTRRARAVEYSDLYSTRLAVHRYASYATLPLFAAQYIVGRKLISQGSSASPSLRGVHGALAGTVAALFAVNTLTGVWNLWDSRKDPNGRARRTVHSLMMIAADAGFVATGATAPDDDGFSGGSSGRTHQAIAISSMGVALASYVMMLVWKD